jgi:hypothetical protein
MSTALLSRVRRLEANGGGRCPACVKPLMVRGTSEVPRCPLCGGERLVVRLLRDPDFYRNAARLDELLVNPPR